MAVLNVVNVREAREPAGEPLAHLGLPDKPLPPRARPARHLRHSMARGDEVTVDTLKHILEAFNRHDLDAIMAFFADDCVLRFRFWRGASCPLKMTAGPASLRQR